MPVATLADVTSYNAHQRKKLLSRVLDATEEQRLWRPAPNRWSLQEHLEHIALSCIRMVGDFEHRVAEAKRQGLVATHETPRAIDALSVLLAAGAIGQKRQAPAETQPAGRALGEIVAILDRERERALACAAELPHLDTDRVTFRYPVIDVEFNLAQFWHFQGLHEAAHVRHAEDNLSAWRERRGA